MVWNFSVNNKLQKNSRDKSRDASHTTFKNISEKILSRCTKNEVLLKKSLMENSIFCAASKTS